MTLSAKAALPVGPAALRSAAATVRASRGAGEPLDADVRVVLEDRFGESLAGLRMHTGPQADRACAEIGADAFASGSDIFVRGEAYRPHTAQGVKLLAHETAHALRQATDRRSGTAHLRGTHTRAVTDVAVARADREVEAELAAVAVSRGRAWPMAAADREAGASGVAAAVDARLAPEEQVIIERHASWEHRLLGDAATADLSAIALKLPNRGKILSDLASFLYMWHTQPELVTEQMITARYPYIRPLRMLGNGLLVTYGELNTLPDYMGNPEVLFQQPKEILLPILQAVRQEGYNKIQGLRGGWLPAQFDDAVAINTGWGFMDLLLETRALDNLTWDIGPQHTNHYTALVGRNACHFAPYSWYRWSQFYGIARDLATQAYAAADPRLKARLTYMAWMNHGYADHFLQDSFAAGHLVNKTLIMQWFVEWAAGKWYVPVADWDAVKTMTAARQPGIAAMGLYNPANPGATRDPQTSEEQGSLAARMAMTGVQADGSISQAAAYQNFLTFMNGSTSQCASGVLHDHFNAKSLWVASANNRAGFQIWGDDTMLNGGDGVRIASETAHLSQQSIIEILASGSTKIQAQDMLDRMPTQVRAGNGDMLSLQAWQMSQEIRNLAWSLFPDVHYFLLRAFRPRIGNISVDQAVPPSAQAAPSLDASRRVPAVPLSTSSSN